MPALEKNVKDAIQRIKQLLRKVYQGTGKHSQWVLQPVRIKKIESADPRH
jgi:hypothetical protein